MSEKEKTSDVPSKGQAAKAFWSFCLAAVFFWVLCFYIGSGWHIHGHIESPRATCAANLRCIARGMAIYVNEKRDILPAAPSLLIAEGHAQIGAFMCPSVADQGLGKIREEDGSSISEEEWGRLVDAESDYLIIFRNIRYDLAPDSAVQIYELPANHKNKGVNLGAANGSVRWGRMPEFLPQIQESHDVLSRLRKARD